MSSVGILTFHHAHNFGAVLQAWSLASAVAKLGHRVEVIDYRPVAGHEPARRGWRRLVPSLGKMRMDSFVSRNIPLSPKVLNSPDEVDAYIGSQSYDALITGSDQVWMIFDHASVDRPYFLGVTAGKDVRRLSYAPSAGSMTSFGPYSPEVAPFLQVFDAISVRDGNTKTAVTELGIGPITRVVDPTLIADFKPLLRSNAPSAGTGDIIVVGKMDAAAERYIRLAAQSLGARVRAVGTRTSAADRQVPFASPADWLNAIGQARLVITSLFHGAAVSMALRRPFVALDCGGRAFKLTDLCAHFGISDRILLRRGQEDYAQDQGLLDLDYSELGPRIDKEAADSLSFLERAING